MRCKVFGTHNMGLGSDQQETMWLSGSYLLEPFACTLNNVTGCCFLQLQVKMRRTLVRRLVQDALLGYAHTVRDRLHYPNRKHTQPATSFRFRIILKEDILKDLQCREELKENPQMAKIHWFAIKLQVRRSKILHWPIH